MIKRGTVKRLLVDFLIYNLGSMAFGLAVSMFTAPNELAPGGVSGLATMLNYLSRQHLPFELPIGMLSLIINLPLLAAAWWRLGRRFTGRTLVCTLLSSLWVDAFAAFVPPFQGEMILTAIFGGALMGLGVGLILSRGGTTGGSEIVASLLERRWPHIPIGKLILVVDGCIIALSAVVYGQLESPLYAVVLVFISAQVTDWVVYGGRRGKMALILCKDPESLTKRIMTDLDRGVTLLKSVGGYTGREQSTLLCAVGREQVYLLKRLVFDADPDAFFMLLTTDEVVGFGWQDPNGHHG